MSKNVTLSPKGYSILGGLIIIGGILIFMLVGYPSYQTAKESLSWPQVEGSVIESRVAEVESKSGHRRRSKRTMYRPEVVFQYTVNGKTYTANEVYHMSTSHRSSNKKDSYEVVSQYPVGAIVQVYYKESDPGVSVLEPGIRGVQYAFIIASLALMLIGLHVLINKGLRRFGSEE